MHIRFSSCRGLEIVDSSGILLGMVIEPLIQADTGKILGFYCVPMGAFSLRNTKYISALDIIHFGTRITIRNEEVICNPEEIIRLQSVLEDKRSFLRQKIRTESGEKIGICADVQFDTETMHIEWLFPKKFFKWGDAISIHRVLEVRQNFILISNKSKMAEESSSSIILERAASHIPETS
ncbi:MAG: hypothetical protein KAS32_17560 [Candidatus Peribacteraceae bacterium]|nr:hypothetical protein [Candidatus Peribacteraceae bacterium]